MPKGTVIRGKAQRRIKCIGQCGRKIDLRYNSNGLCRKCQKKMDNGKLRIVNRKERGTLD